MFLNPPDDELRERLGAIRTIAVVGLSDQPDRDSHRVATYLAGHGYKIVPINPNLTTWEARQSFPDLASAVRAAEAIGRRIDLVDVFRRRHAVAGIVDEMIRLGLDAMWTQLGVIDREAGEKARDHGIWTVMDHCLAVEHRRLCRGAKGPDHRC